MTRIIVTLWAACGLLGGASLAQAQGLLVFGDSLSDSGRAWQHSLAQAGEAVPPSPPYWQGRFSNGPVAVEVMAQTLGHTLDNHAWGGATTDTRNLLSLGFGDFDGTGVQSQVAQHLQATPSVSPLDPVVLWAGGNDLLLNSGSATVGHVLGNLEQVSQQLIGAGARKLLLPLLPDMGMTPMAAERGADSVQALHEGSEAINQGLRAMAATLAGQHPGVHVQVFDTPAFVQGLLAAGLDGSTPCVSGGFWGVDAVCANPDQHLFWDGTHFSAVVHQQLGLAMAAAVPEPSAWALWATGLLALGGLARRRSRARSPLPVNA